MISTKTHAYLDYVMGILLIVLPLFVDVPDAPAPTILILLGMGTVLYSLITDYELGIASFISMKVHLGTDLAAGIFLIAAPWTFSFAESGFWIFVILGIVEVLAAMMTAKKRGEATKH